MKIPRFGSIPKDLVVPHLKSITKEEATTRYRTFQQLPSKSVKGDFDPGFLPGSSTGNKRKITST